MKISHIKIIFIGILCCGFALKTGKSVLFDERRAILLVDLYIDNMTRYCAENYNTDTYADLTTDIFFSAQTDMTSDIEGSIGSTMIIGNYLNNLQKKGMIVTYSKEYTITTCRYGDASLQGCLLTKTIKYKGQKTTKTITEFVEIVEKGARYSIGSIHSNIVNPLEVSCTKGQQSIADNTCKLTEQAEKEVKSGDIALAAARYEQAKSCGEVKSPVLEKALKHIDNDSLYREGLKKAGQQLESDRYEEALTLFENIQKAYTNASPETMATIQRQIKTCKDEITFSSLSAEGDFYYNNNYYPLALSSYDKALIIKYDPSISVKRDQANKKIQEAYVAQVDKEIARAEQYILQQEQFDEGFRILMKYRRSDRISGLQYFLMAQIANSPSKTIRQEFKLDDKTNRCRLVRQFMLNAANLGYQSEDYDIFLNEILKRKDRSCE
jgi:tetratricopeptide (TPR) repeat protein